MHKKVVGLLSLGIGGFAVALAACSSGNGGGTAATSSDFIDQYCTYVAKCCGAESYPSDGKQCRSLLGAFTGGSTYNATAGNQCLAAVKSASDSDSAWCVDNTAQTNSACNAAFGKSGGGGSVQPGGTCTTSSDCASPPTGDEVTCRDYFDFNSNTSTRICQVFVPGKAGDGPCLGTETSISGGTETSYNDSEVQDGGTYPSQGVICRTDDGVTCENVNGSGYKCVALGQVGDTCTGGSGSCVSSAYCDFTSGKCAARGQTGDSCSASSSSCVTGDYCDSATSKCTAQLASNAACTSSQQCQSNDCTNGKCGAGTGALGLSLLCGNAPDGG